MGMADPVPGWNRQFDQKSQRDALVDERAVELTASHMKHCLDYQDVRNAFKARLNEDTFWEMLAKHVRNGSRPQLFEQVFEAVEADVYMWKLSEASKQLDDGPNNKWEVSDD